MDSVYDSIDSSLEKLEEIYTEEASKFNIWHHLRNQILFLDDLHVREIEMANIYVSRIRNLLGFLSTFARCIREWVDASDYKAAPAGADSTDQQQQQQQIQNLKLDSLVNNVEAVIINTAGQLAELACWQERASGSGISSLNFQHRTWSSKVFEILYRLQGEVSRLKDDIEQACLSLLRLSGKRYLQPRTPMADFNRWKKFDRDVQKLPDGRGVRGFQHRLSLVVDFLQHLLAQEDMGSRNTSNNPGLEDFIIHVRSVVLSAGLEVSKWWLHRGFKEGVNDSTFSLFHLQRKIGCTNPEFLDMSLRLLKTLWTTMGANNNASRHKTLDPALEMFSKQVTVSDLGSYMDKLPERELLALHTNMISLITSVLEVAELKENDAQRFMTQVKMVIMEVADHCSSPPREGRRNPNMLLDLHTKIWLIKLESFIRVQLITTRDILSLEELSDALNQGIQYLDLEGGQAAMKRGIQDSQVSINEPPKQILTFMEELANVVASLDYFFGAKETKKARNLLFHLLLKILFFEADSILMKVFCDNEDFRNFIYDKQSTIHEVLKSLTEFVRNQPEGSIEYGKIAFVSVDSIACGVISLYHSFLANKIPEEMIKHANHLLANLLDNIKIAMAELDEIYILVPRSTFPKTIGLGFLDSLLRKVRELPDHKTRLNASVRHQIEEIIDDLEFLRSFLCDTLHRDIEILDSEKSSCIVDVAYEAEYIIDSIVGGREHEWLNVLWLYNLIEAIRQVKSQVAEVCENKTHCTRLHNVAQSSSELITTAVTPRTEEAMVGLNDEQDIIIDRLTGGFQQRDVVSIVGMPGIGKTTLANNVYNSQIVKYHFHIRAWCSVSAVHQRSKLLLDMLSQITAITDNILAMTDEDLELKLYQLLKQKRYLIVLDDLWTVEAWDDLGRSFPNDGNGSRILITTRFHNVALKAKVDTDPHPLRLLSDAEGWDLLQMKIFHEERCPKELMGTGPQIAKSCKGLALAIVAIAGVLRRTDRNPGRWKEIAENLSSRIVDDPEQQCMSILELSYIYLPDYLKPCFLYFGAFQEDEDIPVRKLIRLWIAEDFVKETELKSLEDLAEDYLKDLIDRCLVIFSQRSSRGGVKTCRVHDMLHILCQSKAREGNFLRLITKCNEPDSSYDLDYGLDLDYSNQANSITYEDYRLCIRSKRKHFAFSRPSGTQVRSLLFFATSDTYPRCPYDISFISHNFKLIKLLDLECINMGSSFPSGIELLVHLRYLAASGDFDCIPSSIADLSNLEIFLVKGLKGKVELPDTFWCMVRLRHVHVSEHAVLSFQAVKSGSYSQLVNLVALSSLVLPYGENTGKILGQFPYLQKLRCIFLESWDDSHKCNQFPSLDILTRLESLKISYHGRALHPGQFCFPTNLKKLTLSHFRLPWDYMSVIGKLQNLEVLKLLQRSFDGEIWDMEDGEFSKLKFLKLDTLNIVNWNASSDPFPCLQRLVLRCCNQLQAVPSTFGEIPTLEMIEVRWCGDSAEESVRQIKQDADEKLKVLIDLSVFDSR